MTDIAIRVQGLGKRYRLGQQVGYKTLRETLLIAYHTPTRIMGNAVRRRRQAQDSPQSPVSSPSQPSGPPSPVSSPSHIWALKDVSFEVKQGEAVGIIGRNGSGKSTLLKILSRITAPTEGQIEIRGRVGSLLEVGTGFHPELTGRENIHLNGAILGMKRVDVDRKFDEIVAFSEIEKFLDTPVKRYSSGMYVRLAFAVAAHLEPEILIVDEVLAVGDAAFQKKCLGKMDDVSKGGRTVLFVSHNMAAVENLCQRALVLNQGQVQYIGGQSEAIAEYVKEIETSSLSLRERKDRVGSGEIRVVGIEAKDANGNVLDALACGRDANIYLYFEAPAGLGKRRVIASLMVKTMFDVPVFLHYNKLSGDEFGELPQRGAFVCHLQQLPLPASTYRVGYSIMADGEYLDSISDAAEIAVIGGDFFHSGEIPPISHGVCLVKASWHVQPSNSVSCSD